jgi:hypothetical protein
MTVRPHTIRAIQAYAAEGHTLLGVGLLFGFQPGGRDDNALAPVFGLAEQDTWRKSGGNGAPFAFVSTTTRLLRSCSATCRTPM